MNQHKPKTVFEERDELRRDNELLKARLGATEEALAQVQRESAKLRDEYTWLCGYPGHAAMAVCEAAVAGQIAENAYNLVSLTFSDDDGIPELLAAKEAAWTAMHTAIIEYRAQVARIAEAPKSLREAIRNSSARLSPSKQAAVDRGIAEAEKVGEAWENN